MLYSLGSKIQNLKTTGLDSCSNVTPWLFYGREAVMVNFMCLLDCAMGCSGIWSYILGVSVRVFVDEINI